MSNDIENLKQWIKDAKTNISRLSRITGLSRQYIYQILNDEIKSVSTDTFRSLCQALNKPLTLDNTEKATISSPTVKIPVYGTIPAGIPTEMIDNSYITDYEEINAHWLKGGNSYFGLKVRGDSMYPEFRDGDVLILKKSPNCENGDYCAVSINSTECTFKKVIKEISGILLQPLNPIFMPQYYTNEQIEEMPITILGIVVEVRRSYAKTSK